MLPMPQLAGGAHENRGRVEPQIEYEQKNAMTSLNTGRSRKPPYKICENFMRILSRGDLADYAVRRGHTTCTRKEAIGQLFGSSA